MRCNRILAVYQLVNAPVWNKHHLDGTERRYTHMENKSVRIPWEGGHKCATLSSYILPEDATVLTGVAVISQAYHEGREYLTDG